MSRNKPTVPEPAATNYTTTDFAVAGEQVAAIRLQLATNPRAATAAANLTGEIDAIVARRVNSLAALRRARELTQAQLAGSLDISQGDVSKIEQRTNIMLTTLARFIEATGGHLRIVADYGNDHIEVELDNLINS